jgi:hypothetical protein
MPETQVRGYTQVKELKDISVATDADLSQYKIANSGSYNDTFNPSAAETGASSLADDLDYLRSAIKRILGELDWIAIPADDLVGLNDRVLSLEGSVSSNIFTAGGNAFGAVAILGTNDAFALAFETNNVERARFLSTGAFGIGNTAPTSLLDLSGAFTMRAISEPAVAPASQGRIYYDSISQTFKVSENGGGYTDLTAGGGFFTHAGNSLGTDAIIGTNDNFALVFETNGVSKWIIQTSGHLLANTDNIYDVGASGATRPRTGYFGTSLFSAAFITSSANPASTGLFRYSNNQAQSWRNAGNSTDISILLNANDRFSMGAAIELEASDLILLRAAAGHLQLGIDSATATSHILSAADGLGTDKVGGSLLLQAGQSTGSGSSGSVSLQTAYAGGTGASKNILVDRVYINGVRKGLTDATPVNIFEVALPSGDMAGIEVIYTVRASDATEHQVLTGRIPLAAVNKAGVYTLSVGSASETTVVSSGTLSCAWDLVSGTNKITVTLSADTSLTTSTFDVAYTVVNNSGQGITIL